MRPSARLAIAIALSAALGGCNLILGIDDPKHRPTQCGDGLLVAGEACDDGNAVAGDGCDPSCVEEPGYHCKGSPSQCLTACGDGVAAGAEACDDGNAMTGDGCAECAVEPDWQCNGRPSACVRICGNGALDGAELCDDGNAMAGDGCAECAIEPGWQCEGAPSACAPVCGDGAIVGAETCDDQNTDANDGCDPSCAIEHGFQCSGQPSSCGTVCGDGFVAATEQCDDGNKANGDGCDAACTVEHGYSCDAGEPSVCSIHCGDGSIGQGEVCDDGNKADGDGCSATCKLEEGFTCSGEPSVCPPICGDGMVVLGEGCDDGNAVGGDGCELCQPELGWMCGGQPSACAPICGDGFRFGDEQCDDGNTADNDCCSSACKVEAGCEIEPNGSTAEADTNAALKQPVLFTGAGAIRGAISPIGDSDYFAMDLSQASSVLHFETFDGGGFDCAGAANTKLWLLDSNGIGTKYMDDDKGIGLCSAMTMRMFPGSYYLRVEQAMKNAEIAAYKLEVTEIAPFGAGAETENNDSPISADILVGSSGYVAGSRQLVSDVDYYAITVPALKSIRAEIIEDKSSLCTTSGGGLAANLQLIKQSNGIYSTIAEGDYGSGRGSCALIDGTGGSAALQKDPGAHSLAGGVYYLRVAGAKSPGTGVTTFDYRLAIIVR